MKKQLLTILIGLSLGILPLSGCHKEPAAPSTPAPTSWKVLFVGNSFSDDTAEYVAEIARDCGIEKVNVARLYQGGCSIRRHAEQAKTNAFAYEYYTNSGDGWQAHGRSSIDAALANDHWDWVVIQHGSADGSLYADKASYERLPELVAYIRKRIPDNTRIAFNMTWVGERNSHAELISYGNNQKRYYHAICALTKDTVAATQGIDRIVPTGTAIYNARSTAVRPLFRDGYHLSFDNGRYIAGLTLFATLTEADIKDVSFVPDGVDAYAKAAAIESARNAVTAPYTQTPSALNQTDFN